MMKNYICYAVLAALLLLLAACESGGKFQVLNQTSFPLYVTVGDGDEVTIAGGANRTFEIETEKQHIFNPDVEKTVPVHLIGETYRIYDEGAQAYTDSTEVTIKVGQTLKAYIKPNRASFKVVNSSSQNIDSVCLYKHNFVVANMINRLDDILPGEIRFLRVDYATPNNNFYYYATVDLEDGTSYSFGDEANILLKDQQFLITITDPE